MAGATMDYLFLHYPTATIVAYWVVVFGKVTQDDTLAPRWRA